jgi:pSer/pThr/pTyr-binding forkhead associated (FHA) protein
VTLVDCEKHEIPVIELDVYKDGHLFESITLENKEVFTLGRNDEACSVQLLHESISGVHAAFVVDKEKGVMLIDLGSEYGTTLNGTELVENVPNLIQKNGDVVVFGASTRSYKVKIDYSRMLKAQEQALKALEIEIDQLENLKEDEELDVDHFK